MREVVVVSGVRTAIGTFGGSLKDVPPTQLGAIVVAEVLKRAQVKGDEVGHVVFGHVVNTEPKDMYLARVAALNGGVAQSAPCLTLNRLCGSGLQAIISAAQSIMLGDADIAIGGGAENMSRGPFILPTGRWGQRMGDFKAIDMMIGALHDPFDVIHMGVTAENVADEVGHHARRAGQARGRESPPRGDCNEGRPLQKPDRPGRDQGQKGRNDVRRRRTFPRRRDARGHGEAEAGVREGKRYGHRGQCIRNQ